MVQDVARKERDILLWNQEQEEKQRKRQETEQLMAGLAQENLDIPVRNHFSFIGH